MSSDARDSITPEPRNESPHATASTSSHTMASHIEADAGIRFKDGHDLDHTQTKLDLKRDARAATEKEQTMSLLEGVRTYPKAIAWSMLISTCIVMEGYQVCLLSNFYAFPQFNEQFGTVTLADGTKQVSAAWQAGLSNGANVGSILGLFLNGIVSERFGYRKTVLCALFYLTGILGLAISAKSVKQLLAFEILAGLPWGIFQTLTITYASEVCPVALRGYLTTYVNFCWGIGQVLGIGVIKSMLGRTDALSWKIPYAIQWIWPVPLFIGVLFAPESPWWLVRHGKIDQAKRSIIRLTSKKDTNFNVDETIAMMQHTTQIEEKITAGASYWDCFKGVDLRRTEIVCMVWAIQNLAGNSFSGYSTYYLQQGGLPTSSSYSFALGQYSINCVGVFGAWFLLSRGIGRRTLYICGLFGLFTMLLVMGSLGSVKDKEKAALAAGGMMIGWAAVYQLTVGTIAYSLVGELPSRRLLIKTVVLGRNLYNIVGIVTSVVTPYMVNPTAWGWGLRTAYLWCGIAFLCAIYCYFRLPEPRGRTFAELDLLFEHKVSARKFASTRVDVFGPETDRDSEKAVDVDHIEKS